MKKLHFAALAMLVPSISMAAEFAGSWRLENTFNGKVSSINCNLMQKDNSLSGSCKPDLPGMEAADLKGTVDGNRAKWGYDLVFNGKPARVDYEVVLAADGTVTGKLLRNGSDSPIVGKRQSQEK